MLNRRRFLAAACGALALFSTRQPRDSDGIPIVNSAGEYFDPPPTIEITNLRMTRLDEMPAYYYVTYEVKYAEPRRGRSTHV